ncbi:hypothetical protein ACTXT7_000064 [Hymenolepis weldensis]
MASPSKKRDKAHVTLGTYMVMYVEDGLEGIKVRPSLEEMKMYHSISDITLQLTISVENGGHDLLFAIIFGVITFSGGPLSYTYRLSEMRLKFGSSADRGSEHRVNSFAYPGEIPRSQ